MIIKSNNSVISSEGKSESFAAQPFLADANKIGKSSCLSFAFNATKRSKISSRTEIVQGEVMDADSVEKALLNVTTAYYLVHSMGSRQSYEEIDRQGAEIFATSAKKMGVKRIIYLGGLGRGEKLSPHLKSRQEVGKILSNSGVSTLELRSSIIIGSGSLSFELIRALVERLPSMTPPKWVRPKTQTIADEAIVSYLIDAIELPIRESRIYEVGGPDRVSYSDLLKEYAKQRGLKRLIIPVPVLSPGLSSLWLGLITPIYSRVGRKLISSVQNETVVTDESALKDFSIKPMSTMEAIDRALKNEDQEVAETRWADAISSAISSPMKAEIGTGNRKVDSQVGSIKLPPKEVFAEIQQIGGEKGWYFANWLWRVRGYLCLLYTSPSPRDRG